ncbi:MAG: MarC family protein [Verrucomicrobia bacterium]|nr:MarC family protein [Verrucomicrobiota bacterium]
MSIWQIAFALFFVANPIGNAPACVSIVKDFDFKRQRVILFRESIFSFILALFYLFVGEKFFQLIQIKPYAISLAGGTVLLLIALGMIFPPKATNGKDRVAQEPFIVPIAIPLISGGGVLSTIMYYSAETQNTFTVLTAIIIAWIGVTAVITSSAYLQKILGKRGLIALEQLMGMILAMISTEIFVKGFTMFIKEFH